jgi:sulfur carrier protein
MTKITLNGTPQEVKDATTIAKLITSNNIPQPNMVSVQLNEEFVLREDFESAVLKEGDSVDFLYFMGGGTCG